MTHSQRSLIALVFLAMLLAFGYLQTQAPTARTDTDLDYAAITEHVAVIAAKPHPTGSVANREVRDYIVKYFESLGLDTEIQKATVVYRHPFQAQNRTIIGNVENIIARLPGSSGAAGLNSEDLVLMAHYDSRADGPGAGDDASGTASIMDVARIMAAGPPPLHDVVFLITDGEEMGLLGAQAYFRQHSSAKNTGLVLNFEARGSYGASYMFETSNNNGWLIEQLLEVAPDLNASSLSYEIYQRMPNDTDMSISRGEGIEGLNFAFISGLFDYHAITDTPENLDPNTLAQQANYVLATAQHFANLDEWQSGASNKTYFNVWKGVMVSYGQGTAVAIGVVVLLFGLWLFSSALRSGTYGWVSLGTGLVALIVLLIMVSNVFESMIDYQASTESGMPRLVSLGEWPLLGYFILTFGVVTWFGHAIKRGLSQLETIAPGVILAMLSLLSGRPWLNAVVMLVVLVPVLRIIRSRAISPDLCAAALTLWWLMAAVILYVAPNASYILIWPLASVLLGYLLINSRLGGFQVSVLSSVIPLALLPPLVVLAYLALGTSLPQGIMILSALCLLLLWPLLHHIASMWNGKSGLVFVFGGLLMTLVMLFGRDFDERHPLAEELFFVFDVDGQEGFWASTDAKQGTWIGDFMGDDAGEFNFAEIIPGYQQMGVTRQAAVPLVEVASLFVTSDEVINGVRELGLKLRSPLGAEYISLFFPRDNRYLSITVNGFPVELPVVTNGDVEKTDSMKEKDQSTSEYWWRWRWYGLPQEGAEIVIRQEVGQPVTARIIEVDYGMPEGAPVRPDNSMPESYGWSDSMVIYQTLEFD